MPITWNPITEKEQPQWQSKVYSGMCRRRAPLWKNDLAGNAVTTLLAWVQDICGRDLCLSALSLKRGVCFIWAPARINVGRLRFKKHSTLQNWHLLIYFKPPRFSECLADQNQVHGETDITLPITFRSKGHNFSWRLCDFTLLLQFLHASMVDIVVYMRTV